MSELPVLSLSTGLMFHSWIRVESDLSLDRFRLRLGNPNLFRFFNIEDPSSRTSLLQKLDQLEEVVRRHPAITRPEPLYKVDEPDEIGAAVGSYWTGHGYGGLAGLPGLVLRSKMLM